MRYILSFGEKKYRSCTMVEANSIQEAKDIATKRFNVKDMEVEIGEIVCPKCQARNYDTIVDKNSKWICVMCSGMNEVK